MTVPTESKYYLFIQINNALTSEETKVITGVKCRLRSSVLPVEFVAKTNGVVPRLPSYHSPSVIRRYKNTKSS